MHTNEHGQPIGAALPEWQAPPVPARSAIYGRYCSLVPLSLAPHGVDLWLAVGEDTRDASWTYLPYGPFATQQDFLVWLAAHEQDIDPLFFAIVDGSGKAVGWCAYLRIEPAVGCIEIGHLYFSPRLQKTVAATEAMYLMMRQAFDLGYRRYEWKCDALNEASRRAALRLGFSYEGLFRQARVVKGRNRDTAWFSIIDSEWPALRGAFEHWLVPENFGEDGTQIISLSSLTTATRSA